MTRVRFAILFAILFNNGAQAGELRSIWQESRAEHYRPAPADEVARAEQLFTQMFAGGATAPELTEKWQALGFMTTPIGVGQHRFVIVREAAARRDGRGFFVFCLDPSYDDILQAPHAYADLHTGTIALQLVETGRLLALAMNTVPRRYEHEGRKFGADMAHLEGTYMIAFSRAYARSKPAGRIYQLHGFAAKKRAAGPASEAQIIVSSGATRPSIHASRSVACLREVVGNRAKLYPRDVRELGGTRNRIGAELRALGHDGFVHIEMEYAFRRALRKDGQLRRRLLNCLQAVVP